MARLRHNDLKKFVGLRQTRFAPSPTGQLHLGHLASAIYVWGLAESLGVAVSLRFEDHDRQRSREEHTQAILAELVAFGFWDSDRPYVMQSQQIHRYENALLRLAERHHVYACICSRAELAKRTGQRDGGELRYDGYCREREIPWEQHALRVVLPNRRQDFYDGYGGKMQQLPAQQGGDLLLRDRHQNWTYTFCVVIDDAEDGIDLVIRGRDILDATGRQLLLADLLGVTPPRAYIHHPLITDGSGQKLSKRFGSRSLKELREAGYCHDDLLGQAAYAVGLIPSPEPLKRDKIRELFA